MKAILVIDIDDRLIEDEDDRFAIDGYLMQESDCAGCFEAIGGITNAPLIPLSKDSCRIAFDDEDETVVYIRTYKNAHDKVLGEVF